MINLRNFTDQQLDVLDKSLVRYEFQIKDQLKFKTLSPEQRTLLENDLAIVNQIYNHLRPMCDQNQG